MRRDEASRSSSTATAARSAGRRVSLRTVTASVAALALTALGVGLDQMTKLAALNALGGPGGPIQVTSFFTLRLGFNTGVSFGLFRETLAAAPWVLGAFAAAAGAGFAVAGLASRRPSDRVGFGLIAAGALSNAIDRWRLGAVVDYLDFHWRGWSWPAFNAADVMIVVGAAALVLLAGRSTDSGEAK